MYKLPVGLPNPLRILVHIQQLIVHRTRRKKCIVIPGSCRCVLCESQNIICSKTKSIEASIHRLVKHESQPTVTHSGKGTSLWAKSLCIELVELYFRYIHDQFHSLFHKTSFLNDLEHGQAPMVLVYGMMALSARYVHQCEKC